MNTLFDIGPILPTGFNYCPDFITEAEEMRLIKEITRFELQNMQFHEYLITEYPAGSLINCTGMHLLFKPCGHFFSYRLHF